MSFNITYRQRTASQETTQKQFIAGDKIEIGRGTGCDIPLNDLRIFLRHASIEKRGAVYILEDLPDENGTYVNGEDIKTHQLANNDTIQIGSYVLRIRLSSPEAPLDIDVEHFEPEFLPDSRVQGTFRANWQLGSGWWTKKRLTIAGVVFVLLLPFLAFIRPSGKDGLWYFRTLWAPGQVSQAHGFIERDCAQCHGTSWQPVADTTCKTCHDGPQHHQNQVFTPGCVTCHTEHSGRQRALTSVGDQVCTQCHADLRTTEGFSAHFASSISSFTTGHPEFAVQVGSERVRLSDRAHLRDVTQVHLNHAKHLNPNNRGPEDFEVLKCSNCHQVDAQRAYMTPITYKQDCMRCHPLAFDQRFPEQVVPHDTPEVVHAFLDTTFIRYCRDRLLRSAHASHGPGSEPFQQRRPGVPRTPAEESRTIAQCAEEEVQAAEAFLFAETKQNGCWLCHVVQAPAADDSPRTIAKTALPQRWLPHSVFDHQAHARAGRSCEDCHSTARTSEKTADVLLPDIASCQECHAMTSGVPSTCVTCHVYHDRSDLDRGLAWYMEDRFVGRGAQLHNPPPVSAPR